MDTQQRQGVEKGIEGDIPLGRLGVFVLGSEDLKSLAAVLPGFVAVGFHCSYDSSFFDVVDAAESVD